MRKTEKPENASIYLSLLLEIYRDAAVFCEVTPSSANKDIETLTRRATAEGLVFLTKDLPSLGKCLDKALSSDCPFHCGADVRFKISKRKPYLPILFGGFWKMIFDDSGCILTSPNHKSPLDFGSYGFGDLSSQDTDLYRDVELSCPLIKRQIRAVRAVRQICFLFYKLNGAYAPEDAERVLSQFVEVDDSLPARDEIKPLTRMTERALGNARLIIGAVLGDLDLLDIRPRHGPGAVATGEKPWNKMKFRRLYRDQEEVYPFTDYFFLNYSHLCDKLETLELLTELDTSTAKVVLVDKDSRGPRLISEEPLEKQWIQQGQFRAISERIESSTISAGFVNFTNQEINRNLARKHSMPSDDVYITVDMKDASDRVSCWLVDRLFPRNIQACLYATRSVHTKLPTGHIRTLKKFAPMGSSVCFPIEALIFWALAVGSIRDIRITKDLYSLPDVYVYGDDIILRKEDFAAIRHTFEELHLKLNESKCCTGRFFRESCGYDAFKMESVAPIRVKTRLDDKSPSAALSCTSAHNALRDRGYMRAASFLERHVVSTFGPVPILNKFGVTPLALVKEEWTKHQVRDHLLNTYKTRNNRKFCMQEILIPYVMPCVLKRGRPNWEELFRRMLMDSFPDPFGLRETRLDPCRHAVPHQSKMRGKWVGIDYLT